MSKLTDTQSIILSRAATRPGNLALPLPPGLHGAAARKVVSMLLDRGWLDEVEANLRQGEPLWRETGDGHGTTLVVTEAGLLVIGIEPVVAQTMAAIRKHATDAPAPETPTPCAGTKQAMLIAMLQTPEGATMEAIIAATSWQAHSARGVMSGALKKRLGLVVTSAKEEGRGRVYRIGPSD
jgi:hypothetical protein